MPGKKHVHKYYLRTFSNKNVWYCGDKDCSHYWPRHMQEAIEGKSTECWDCFNHTTMSEDSMNYAVEHNNGKMLCANCIAKREGEATPVAILEAVEKIKEQEEKSPNPDFDKLLKEITSKNWSKH